MAMPTWLSGVLHRCWAAAPAGVELALASHLQCPCLRQGARRGQACWCARLFSSCFPTQTRVLQQHTPCCRVNVDGSSTHQAAKRAAKKRAQREAKRAQRAASAQHAGSGEESAGQTGDSLAQAVEGQQGVPARQQQEQAQVSAGPTNDSGEGAEAEQLRRAEDAMLALLRCGLSELPTAAASRACSAAASPVGRPCGNAAKLLRLLLRVPCGCGTTRSHSELSLPALLRSADCREEEEAAEAAAAQAARRAAKRRAKKQQRRQQQGSGEGSSAEGEGAGEADTAVGMDSQLMELKPAVSMLSTSGSASAAAGPGQPALACERGAHHSGSSSAGSDTGSAGAESAAGGEGARPGTSAAAGSASRPGTTAMQQPAAGEGPLGPPSVPGEPGLHLLPHRAPATPEADDSRPAPASPALQPRHHPVAVPEQQQAAEPQGQPVEQPAAQGQLQQPNPWPAEQPLVATPPQWGPLTARQRGAAAGYRPPMGTASPAAPAQAAWPALSAAPPRLQQPGTQPAAPPRGLGAGLQGPSGGNQLTSTDGAHGACNPAAAAGGARWAECVLCLDSQPDCALLPCRHLALCTPCGEALWHPCAADGTRLLCPVCRAEVSIGHCLGFEH